MRALVAFFVFAALTLPVPAFDFSPPQAEFDKLPIGTRVIGASVTRKLDADSGREPLRAKLEAFSKIGIEIQAQHGGQTRERQVIGWREHILLPELCSAELDAKIDTGARTSALHAVDLSVENRDGEEWVSFHVPYAGVKRTVRHSAKVIDRRKIRNTSGNVQIRYVIETTLVMGNRQWQIEVSLADREKMKFDILLGRTAIRHRELLVDPEKAYLTGRPVPILD